MLEKNWNRAGQILIKAYGQVMLKLDVEERAPLPAGPKIFAANHPTTTDPFFLLALVAEPMSILVTGMCFKVPVFGNYLKLAGHIPVADENRRAAFEAARQRLESGQSVGIFPEGALSPLEGGLHKARTGAARLALLTGAPIIPLGISLQRQRIHFAQATAGGKTETARWYPGGPYAVTIGEPLYLAGRVENRAQVAAASEHIMQRIGSLAQDSARRIPAPQPRSRAWEKTLQTTGAYISALGATLLLGTEGRLILEQARATTQLLLDRLLTSKIALTSR